MKGFLVVVGVLAGAAGIWWLARDPGGAGAADAAGGSAPGAELRRAPVADGQGGGTPGPAGAPAAPEPAGRAAGLARNQEALACLDRGELARAESLLAEAAALDPEEAVFRANLSRARVRLGRAAWEGGRAQEALRWFRAAADADPDGGAPAEWLASVLLRLGERAEAGATVRAALAAFPRAAGLLRLRAELAFLAGDLAAAVADARAALALEDTARARERLQQLEEEERIFREFLTDSTPHFDSRYDPQDAALVARIPQLQAQLEEAWRDVVGALGFQPATRLLVIWLTPERWRGSAPAWSSGLYDGRVRLLVREPGRDDPALRSTMRHELTHAVLHALGGRLPTWLHEGLAQRGEGRDVAGARALLRGRATLPDAAALDGDWTAWTDAARIDEVYAMALSLVGWLEEQAGASALRSLLLAEPAEGFEGAWVRVYARPFAEWESEHRAWLARSDG